MTPLSFQHHAVVSSLTESGIEEAAIKADTK